MKATHPGRGTKGRALGFGKHTRLQTAKTWTPDDSSTSRSSSSNGICQTAGGQGCSLTSGPPKEPRITSFRKASACKGNCPKV
jgi:hypothetical protein